MRGHSLAELLVVLALIGLLAALGIPRLVELRDRAAVEHAAGTVLTAYHHARLAALTRATPVRLEVGADRIRLLVRVSGDSVLVWSAPGPAQQGVALVETPGPVVMTPAGVTMGVANGRYVLTRGGLIRTVVVSRLGRLRVARPRRRARTAGPLAPRCRGASSGAPSSG